MHLAQGHQYVLRLQVDGQLAATAETPVAPCALEDMSERQEAHDNIVLREIHDLVVGGDGSGVHAIGEGHAFGDTCRAAGIEDVDQIIGLDGIGTACHLVGVG